MADEEKPEEEQPQNPEEGENEQNGEPKEEAPVLDEQEQKDLEEDKAEEEKDKEEEQQLDEEGNPIPDSGPRKPQRPLKPEMLKESLSNLAKTFDGLSYAFTKLDIHEKELDGLGEDINNFNLLREFICSNNKIKDISVLSKMNYMSSIDASTNYIKDISFQYSEYQNHHRLRLEDILKFHLNLNYHYLHNLWIQLLFRDCQNQKQSICMYHH